MPSNQNCAIVNNDELRTMRADIEKTGKAAATRSAAVVNASDIARMRRAAQITTDEDAKQQKKIREE